MKSGLASTSLPTTPPSVSSWCASTTSFGPLPAFLVGWLMWVARVTAFAAIANIFVGYLSHFWPAAGGGPGRALALIAMIAPFTVILLQINYMITGVVVVEAVFAYPGFGRMLLDSALSQDVATVQAASLFAVLVSVCTQIAGDLIEGFCRSAKGHARRSPDHDQPFRIDLTQLGDRFFGQTIGNVLVVCATLQFGERQDGEHWPDV